MDIDGAHVLTTRVDIVVRSEYDFVLSDDELFRLSHPKVVCASSRTRSVAPPHYFRRPLTHPRFDSWNSRSHRCERDPRSRRTSRRNGHSPLVDPRSRRQRSTSNLVSSIQRRNQTRTDRRLLLPRAKSHPHLPRRHSCQLSGDGKRSRIQSTG